MIEVEKLLKDKRFFKKLKEGKEIAKKEYESIFVIFEKNNKIQFTKPIKGSSDSVNFLDYSEIFNFDKIIAIVHYHPENSEYIYPSEEDLRSLISIGDKKFKNSIDIIGSVKEEKIFLLFLRTKIKEYEMEELLREITEFEKDYFFCIKEEEKQKKYFNILKSFGFDFKKFKIDTKDNNKIIKIKV